MKEKNKALAALKGAGARLLDLIYPPKCPVCGKLLREDERGACKHCLLELPVNAAEVPGGEFFDKCAAPFRYTGTLRESILRYKFGGRQNYAAFYATYLAASVSEQLAGQYELVSWVPISRRRRLERGYDQAQTLAMQTARRLGVPCIRCLRKKKNNQRQSRIEGAAARRANVKGVYDAVRPERFRGKRVLLIDDIITTGATLSECAYVLRANGAASVVAGVAATAHKTE